MAKLPEESFDVVVTSPPYNIGISYASYEDKLLQNDYLVWLSKVFLGIKRLMKPNASFFLNIGNQNKHPWLTTEILITARPLFELQNNIVWAKSISVGDDSFGHFKPINSKRYLNNNHESIFHFTKGGEVEIDRLAVGVPFKDKSNIARFGHARDKRCAGNIWHIPYKTVQSKDAKFNHPAAYPVELAERCIKLHGGDNLMVFDPFLGSGTTLIAAQNLGHSGTGIEIDDGYANVSRKRLNIDETPSNTVE